MSNIKLDVRVFPVAEPQGNLKAYASVAIEDLVAIRGIRVLDGDKGLFVSMPQSRDKDGKYHDIAFPVNGDLRKQLSNEVLDAYAQTAERRPLAEGLRDGASQATQQMVVPRATERTADVRG